MSSAPLCEEDRELLLKRRLSVLWAAAIMVLTVLLASGAALGITNGTLDENRHPNVGALVASEPFDDGTYAYCTGTLISPTVFLTAAHCDPLTDDGVTFAAHYNPKTSTTYLICASRQCNGDQQNYDARYRADPINDIAVVKFYEPITTITPAELPDPTTTNRKVNLDFAAKGDKFTAVGYGGVIDTQLGGPTSIVYDDQRRKAASSFKSVNQDYLRLSQNLNQEAGGTCDGDSGGPNFFGAGDAETNVIAGITITGDTWCKATNVALRLDTEPVRTFLRSQGVDVPGD
jgi:secreted trypsin-like serine protease